MTVGTQVVIAMTETEGAGEVAIGRTLELKLGAMVRVLVIRGAELGGGTMIGVVDGRATAELLGVGTGIGMMGVVETTGTAVLDSTGVEDGVGVVITGNEVVVTTVELAGQLVTVEAQLEVRLERFHVIRVRHLHT